MRAQEEKMHLRTELNLLQSNRSNSEQWKLWGQTDLLSKS